MNEVRTRFAPSPTGYLHIGGARTALFNFLLARRLGGRFVLRIEDTDQTRNIAGAEQKLLDDLRWLGLEWDEGPEVGGPGAPYFQSQRLERYQAAARTLLEAGQAYYAFETREELDAMRREAEKTSGGFRYPRPEAFPSEADAERARAEGRPVVVRFKTPQRDFRIHDDILGPVERSAGDLDDFVILKADGWPTYHFAVVVDDEAMGITHVLRGQEHLLNTAYHIALQEALGYRTPRYAHLPVILNMGGSKMSKRDKDKAVREALGVALKSKTITEEEAHDRAGVAREIFEQWRNKKTQLDSAALQRLADALAVRLPEIEIHDFRVSGYLPEVVVNFIALLGWSAGDDREKYTLQELCQAFSVERIGKTNAKFDREKLLSFNTEAVAAAPLEQTLTALKDWLRVNPESPLNRCDEDTLRTLLTINKGFRTFPDIELKAGAIYLPDDQISYDEQAVKKVLKKGAPNGLAVLAELRTVLAEQGQWNSEALDTLLRSFADQRELGLGKVAQPLRVAVTGGTISPPIFDTLALLGKASTLARIDRALAEFEG